MQQHYHFLHKTLLICLFMIVNISEDYAQIGIGIFTDCQYCDCDKAGSRYYRHSLRKLEDCIQSFNQTHEIDFVVSLGDLIDRDIASYTPVNKILLTSNHRIYSVIGNHDMEVAPEDFSRVPEFLRLKEPYYSIHKGNWRFIFLNGNDISFQTTEPSRIKEAEQMLEKVKSKNSPNAYDWNGGIGQDQMNWLKRELQEAQLKNKNVILFCHYPLLPHEAHTLWNHQEVLDLLYQYPIVKAWINGHNHHGNYIREKGIHFITLKGMVETEKLNSFAEIYLYDNKIELMGYGREPSVSLLFN